MRYASLKVLVALSLGIILEKFFTIPFSYLIVLILVSFVLSFFTKGLSLYLALILTSFLNTTTQKIRPSKLLYYRNCQFLGIVTSEPTKLRPPGFYRYAVSLKRLNGGGQDISISGKVFLRTRQRLYYGDLISFSGKILPFDYPRNPGLIDFNKFYERQGFIGKIVQIRELKVIGQGQGNPILGYLIYPLRRYFHQVIDQRVKYPERAIFSGILLGEKEDLPKDLRESFLNTGLFHILAVSGMNVAILIGTCLLLFSVIGLRRTGFLTLVILGVIIYLYVGITGFQPSAVRAGLMGFLLILGYFLQRRTLPINGVFIAGILILLFSPFALYDVGFQLSFAATLSIILFSSKIYNLFCKISNISFIRKYLWTALAVSLAAAIGVSPILVYYFFKLPLITVFANLLIVPLVGLATPLAFLVVLLNPLSSLLSKLFAETLGLSLSAIIVITEKLGSLNFASIDLAQPSPLLLLWYYGLLLLTLKFKKGFVLVLLSGLNIVVWSGVWRKPDWSVTFLDIYQGDAIFISLPNKRTMLVDTGTENDEILYQFLKSKGVKAIDLLVLSHPHRDHYGGLRGLKDRIKIRNILVAVDSTNDTIYTKILKYLKEKGTNIFCGSSGQELIGLGVRLEIISPSESLRRLYYLGRISENDLSVVLRLNLKNFTILLPGDLENTSLVSDLSPEAEFLKSPHHGSERANSELLLKAVKPKYIIITGRKNIPCAVKERLALYKIKSYNTRADGALTITGKGVSSIFPISDF